MGLFQSKHSDKKSPAQEAADVVAEVFDDQYREELRASGRDYLKKVMDENAGAIKKDLDATVAEVGSELKSYMTKRLDATIDDLNTEINRQLNERLVEYDRVTKDAQDQAVQSLNRNAVALHEKYQQLGQTLQQTIASQEAMMIGVFEENKARMAQTQEAQDEALDVLEHNIQSSQERSEQLGATLQKSVADQEQLLAKIFEENMERVNATKDAQTKALDSLTRSAQALEEQHQQMSEKLAKTVADQETMLVNVFEENMAQIIEHYLLGALGDQFDMKAQLPLIIGQMEENKQTIVDDMKL